MAETAPTFQDILNLLAALRRRMWLVIVCCLAGGAVAAAISTTLNPVYRATSQVLIDPSVRQPFEDQSAPARYLEDAFVVDSQVTVLQSYSVLWNVVTQLNLAEDPHFGQGAKGEGFLAPIAALFGGSGMGSPETQEAAANQAIDALQGAMNVGREGLTFVISVSVDADTPAKAAIISNSIVENYISGQSEQSSNLSRTVEEKVEDRLRLLREHLRESGAKVEAFRARNNLQSSDQNTLLTDQELAELNTKLTEQRAALAAAEAKASEIRHLIESGAGVEALTDVTSSTTIANLQQQYTTAARLQADLAAELLPSHPQLIRARAQTREIRSLLEAEVRRIASSARFEADVLRDRVANLERDLENVRTKSNIDQKSRIELQELEIEAETNKTLYENLLSRTKEITEIDHISIPNARIISPAIPPESPVWPKKKLIALAGVVLGGMIGVLLAIGREAFALGLRYLLNPQSDVAYAAAGSVATAEKREIAPPAVLSRNVPSAVQSMLAVSYLPRPPHTGSLADLETEELLNSLWDFRVGDTDDDMRPYWRSVFTILKQIQSNRSAGHASRVVITSSDGNHSLAALSVVLAAASLKNFQVLLVDNNSADAWLSQRTLPRRRLAQPGLETTLAHATDFDFLSLTHGRRKYESRSTDSYQLLEGSDIDPDFDLIVISESPMAPAQIEADLRKVADHVIVSVERPAAFI